MAAHGNSEDIVRPQDMAGLCHLHPVQAHLPRFNQFHSQRALFHHPGKPEPLVQALRQFFLPVI
jgi:hypothetical protein